MSTIRLCGVDFAFVVMKPMSLVMSLSLPLMSAFEVSERGKGVVVYVREGGLEFHPLLAISPLLSRFARVRCLRWRFRR